jgi:hypothetical protein
VRETHRPICYSELETRDVAPCYDCGAVPEELTHFVDGKHKYFEVRLFGSKVVLCDFCQVDFDAYSPEYFHRSSGRFFSQMIVDAELREPVLTKDKYCPQCGRRLAFLRFLAEVRADSSFKG